MSDEKELVNEAGDIIRPIKPTLKSRTMTKTKRPSQLSLTILTTALFKLGCNFCLPLATHPSDPL